MNDLIQNHDQQVQKIVDSGFIRIPRAIAEGMYSYDDSVRQYCLLLHMLLVNCSHTGRLTEFRNHSVFCKQGEIFTSAREIAARMRLPNQTIDRLLDKLKTGSYIEREFIKVGQLIRLKDYRTFTSSPKKRTTTPPPAPPSTAGKPETPSEYRRRIIDERRKLMD